MEELVRAYLKLYEEGKMDQAMEIAGLIKQMQAQEDQIAPDEIPEPYSGEPVPRQEAGRQYGVGESALGAAEAALSLGTGLTAGLGMMAGGTVHGIVEAILNAQSREEAANILEQYITRAAAAGTYTPRTEAGRKFAGMGAEALASLPPIMGFSGGAAPVAAARQGARAGVPGVGAVTSTDRAIQAIPGVRETSRRELTGRGLRSAELAAAKQMDRVAEAATRGFGAVRRGVEEILPTVSGRPEDVAAARQAGVRVMTTDVVSPESFATKWLQSVGEKIPIAGTGGPRAAQQRERISAVEDLMREYEAPDAVPIINRVAEDLIQTRSDKLMRFKNEKTQAINNVDSAGVVPVAKTLAAIDDEIRALEGLRTESVQPVIARLMDWRNALQSQNLANIETLRKQIGEAFKAPELASVRGTGEAALSRIYGPLREDMTDFIRQNGRPEDLTRWQVANKQLANLANELKVSSLRTALRKADQTPEAVGALLFSNKPSDVRALFRNLSPEGQRAARIAIMNRAAQKAGGIDNISPDRFANEVKRLGEQIGIAFPQDELAKINGLVRALDLTRRAGQAGVTPPTGVQAVPLLFVDVLSSTFGGPMGATVGATTIGGLARLYESKAVRGPLTALGKAKRNSEAEGRIMGQLENAVAKELAKMTPATVPETARVQLQELEESGQ
jgi:hypothetical protein